MYILSRVCVYVYLYICIVCIVYKYICIHRVYMCISCIEICVVYMDMCHLCVYTYGYMCLCGSCIYCYWCLSVNTHPLCVNFRQDGMSSPTQIVPLPESPILSPPFPSTPLGPLPRPTTDVLFTRTCTDPWSQSGKGPPEPVADGLGRGRTTPWGKITVPRTGDGDPVDTWVYWRRPAAPR